MKNEIDIAADYIKESNYTIAFTGAGISAESGIPPFRGENGIWNKYDPNLLVLSNYLNNPTKTWPVIKEIFYDFFSKANPNAAHNVLAKMESEGLLKSVVTQNIDNLHQMAGSKTVYEFHGNSHTFVCLHCHSKFPVDELELNEMPPLCKKCGKILKPDFIFFGEQIPTDAYSNSVEAAEKSHVVIIIGTTGEVVPASTIPIVAKRSGAKIIEINLESSSYTNSITDVCLKGKATETMNLLAEKLF